MRILVIEDEDQLAELIKRGLEEEGYAVDIAGTGETGEELADSIPYDLVVLDIILPKKDGLEVCGALRAKKIKAPILMLTAKDTIEDKVKGLDNGADDYMVKPFVFEELYARVRALLRREENLVSHKLDMGELVIDTNTRQVWRGQKGVDLTPKEYAILEYLARHPNMVVTRVMLEQHIWNLELDSTSNLVDVFIRKLRRKLDEGEGESVIQTVKGAGYRLRAP
jgi:DNA-binding response OmpR family regulator